MPSEEPTDRPPDGVTYDLDEALTLLAALEDARDTMNDASCFAGVIIIEVEIRLLSSRLWFGNDVGGEDG